MKRISLFTPCFNEEANIEALYSKVLEIMSGLPQYDFEYVIIDNCSEDRTPQILKSIAKKDKRVKIILNNRNFGPTASGSYGFFHTTGDCAICFAADFQEPPEMIPEFVKKWEEGYKVVWARKTQSEESGLMFKIRKLYYKIIKDYADYPQYENVTGFGLYDREVVKRLRETNDPEPNFRNLVGYYGYEVAFIDFVQPKRRAGKSSYNFVKYFSVALHSLITTSTMPLHFCCSLGFLTAGLCFVIGLIYLILKLIYWNSFRIGYAPMLLGTFFIGGIQLIFIGVIGHYIAEVMRRQMNRPLVVEKARFNFDETNADKKTEDITSVDQEDEGDLVDNMSIEQIKQETSYEKSSMK
jgi:glycosyltransferase involved in cell wall biosynthesis